MNAPAGHHQQKEGAEYGQSAACGGGEVHALDPGPGQAAEKRQCCSKHHTEYGADPGEADDERSALPTAGEQEHQQYIAADGHAHATDQQGEAPTQAGLGTDQAAQPPQQGADHRRYLAAGLRSRCHQSGDREQLTHRVIAADDGKQGSGQIAQRSGLQHQRQHYQAAEYQYHRTAHGHHEAFGNCQAGPDMADEAEQPGQQSADEQEVEPDLQSKIVRGIDHGCCASSEWPAPSGEWWPGTIHCSTAVTAISYGHWTVLSQNWLHMRRIFYTNDCRYPLHAPAFQVTTRSEEHTSELQSRPQLVCRLLLGRKNSLP